MANRYWNEYQKNIADDHYYYERSCIRQTFFPGSETAFLKMMQDELGKDIFDDFRLHTCTGIGYHTDVVPLETTMTVVARIFSLMKERGYENLCSVMYHIIRRIHRDVPHVARASRASGTDP